MTKPITDEALLNYEKTGTLHERMLCREIRRLREENEQQRRDLNAWKRMDAYYKKKFDDEMSTSEYTADQSDYVEELEIKNAKLRKVVDYCADYLEMEIDEAGAINSGLAKRCRAVLQLDH